MSTEPRRERSSAPVQLSLFELEPGLRRADGREDTVQLVHYCRFPRVRSDQSLRAAFTKNVSAEGLCVHVDASEPVGALLRLIPRGVDGEPEAECIGRVAWTRPSADGGTWLGIALLDGARPRALEPARKRVLSVPADRRPTPALALA